MNKNAGTITSAVPPRPAAAKTCGRRPRLQADHDADDDANVDDELAGGGPRRTGRWWTEAETMDLLQKISREKWVSILDGKTQRNGHVFRRLSSYMGKVGSPRTPEQIRSRWKFLKSMYINHQRKISSSYSGPRTFQNRYSGVMANLIKQMSTSKEENGNSNDNNKNKSSLRTRKVNGIDSNNLADETPGVRMEVFTEMDDDDDDNDNDDLDGKNNYQDLVSTKSSPVVTRVATTGTVAATVAKNGANGSPEIDKTIDSGVDCILGEPSGAGSSELRSILLDRHNVGQEKLATAKEATRVKECINIHPRTLNQYTKKDKVADKLISLLNKQTRLMEEQQKWRRDFVVQQQRWEERVMSNQMKQLETIMVNVTKMIVPMMRVPNNGNGACMDLVASSTGNSMPPMSSSSWSQPQPHPHCPPTQPTPPLSTLWMSNGSQQRM